MKMSFRIGLVVTGLAAIALLLGPMLTLEITKRVAIHKFSSTDRTPLNCVPVPLKPGLTHLEITSSYSFAKSSGYEVGLPISEFQRGDARNIMFTNNNLKVVCFGIVDKSAYLPLERELGFTNVFGLVSSAYQATITGISDQRNMAQLRHYASLLLYKATLAPVGFDRSWLQFDRGDFSGFISGELAKDGKVAVEIYLKEKDEFLTILIKRNGRAGEMSDVYHILSVLKVNPNDKRVE